LVKKISVLNNLFEKDSKGNMNFFSRKFYDKKGNNLFEKI